MTERLTVGSLFSGIGGLDLGLERAGMRVIWQSEIDPYCCRVLNKHWLEVVNHGDIKQIDWSNIERPDVICGGYPCQPFSQAGKRRGEQDERHLWPWVRECISELRPRYAILENVRGHLSLGGTTVIGELASIGYDAEWRVVSAESVGANHRRERIVIVAYPNDTRGRASRGRTDGDRQTQEQERRDITQFRAGRPSADVPNTDTRQDGGWDGSLQQGAGTVFSRADNGRGTQEYAGWKWWETEPGMGRVANGIPSRVDRLRGLGNAVVPQVAEVIGRLVINHHERNNK